MQFFQQSTDSTVTVVRLDRSLQLSLCDNELPALFQLLEQSGITLFRERQLESEKEDS